ncbi:MAG: FAD-dependent oxidoreductase [bacterium]|nr:FAD-dependent oxidoreductase [bacterium]
MTELRFNLVIIGAGPAGLSAAIYALRYNLKTLVLAEVPGGLLSQNYLIENYPGFTSIRGADLATKMLAQAQHLGVEIVYGTVTGVMGSLQIFTVSQGVRSYQARSLILAAGTERSKLEVPGEKELTGKGVSYCSTCDGPLYKDKIVAVIGGGDGAFTAALDLAHHAAKVYLIHRKAEYKAKPNFVELAQNNPKITLITSTAVEAVQGSDKVVGLRLNPSYSGQESLSVDGVFVEIGGVPNRKMADQLGVKVNEAGYIVVGQDQATSLPGVFAAGDMTTGSDGFRQIVTACAEGAVAARSAYRYVSGLK